MRGAELEHPPGDFRPGPPGLDGRTTSGGEPRTHRDAFRFARAFRKFKIWPVARNEDVEFVTLTEQIIEADRQHWISLLYKTSDFRGEPQLTEPDKLSALGWFDLDDLPEPLSAFTRVILPHLR